ncbi:hypothetical protein VV02_22960 [Luteipulveratus mongoliensis]|uniref:Uncharacterized protein n=1 Tax=Luteipulveratus mongoliensis TaxID=571913 RepID=A0A0K1JMV9_9MICO|nr:hypothetical protein VV02_22960 [Luteipulveratus mongoliensis]
MSSQGWYRTCFALTALPYCRAKARTALTRASDSSGDNGGRAGLATGLPVLSAGGLLVDVALGSVGAASGVELPLDSELHPATLMDSATTSPGVRHLLIDLCTVLSP